jgi:hypothetical protein
MGTGTGLPPGLKNLKEKNRKGKNPDACIRDSRKQALVQSCREDF